MHDLRVIHKSVLLALGLMLPVGRGAESTNAAPSNLQSSITTSGSSLGDIIKAANAGDSTAQCNLGIMYDDGTGVTKDALVAVNWYRKAAEQGNANAQFNLGVSYDEGDGVGKDASVAASWYRKAAEQGNAKAQFNLGNMYYKGEGVTKDIPTAANWYRKAAEQGHASAQFNLGNMYREGKGVTKDTSVAATWYLKAGDQGVTGAQCNLGLLYYDGDGVPQDFSEGLAWLIVSASAGNGGALDKLNVLEDKVGVQVTVLAQERSKEILTNIEQSKALASRGKEAGSDRVTGDLPLSYGSGVFVSQDGLIITAAHVVNDSRAIRVLTQQGIKPAHIIKIDTSNDVALLKCEGHFQAVPIKSSSSVKLGQPVFTIGFPDIQLQGFSPKMTQGEISSLSGIQDDPRDWQISVPVQPGNSGGPLFDSHGNVIGLVVAKLDAVVTTQTTGALPEDVNYAVKTAYVLPLLDTYAANLLPGNPASAEVEKTEDVVGRVQNSVVLILVY